MENGDTNNYCVQREEGKFCCCTGLEEGSGEKQKVRLSVFIPESIPPLSNFWEGLKGREGRRYLGNPGARAQAEETTTP